MEPCLSVNQLGNDSIDSLQRRGAVAANTNRPLLILVEGANDVAFLRRLATNLSSEACGIPDLSKLEDQGAVLFVPIGGSDFELWALRFKNLGCPELHLYDGELPPETERRARAIRLVNARVNCRGFLTTKR